MDQESAAASGASLISLTEHEQRYYSGLHALCQADAPAKLSSSKVAELFKASQLPPESLHKVTEVCGAKHLGYFGTAQFYIALKLLAAAQSGLPVRLESIAGNLPLPRFAGLKNEPAPPASDPQGAPSGSVAWNAADRSSFRHLEANADKKPEPWSPPRSPCSSPPRSPLTYRSYPYSKQRNGVDAQISYDGKLSSRSIVQLEQHSSPGHYVNKPAAEHAAVAQASSAERLNQPATLSYSDDDPWRITVEQLDYYTNQFKTLQPDLGALILGAVAKNFFTKSKLPILELSHIWELSDVDRDGALTFTEFCIAFHLIVARKNGYPLPESLPPTLQPVPDQHQDERIPDTPESSEPLIVFEDAQPRSCQVVKDPNSVARLDPTLASRKHDLQEESLIQDGSVTHLGSSREKPTLRLGAFPEKPEPHQELDPQMRTKTRQRSYSSTSIDDAIKKAEEPPTPPPRPQKTHSRASSLDLNKLFQQGAPGVKSGWLLPPPALPPRPSATQVPHFLKVSEQASQNKVQQPNFADFSHFREEGGGLQEESGVKLEEQGPASRFGLSSEDLGSASQQDVSGTPHGQAPQKPIRRKYHPESQNLETGAPPPAMPFLPPAKTSQKLLSRQKREIQMAIRKNRETNAVLRRLNSELQQQLKVVHQERVTLESQLELLRPLAST
ncbi:PREDICTED: ralBP1-associated Eps domain-containing protein 2 isoform X1 [Poecilia mexicana]|uniref:ralBP1-associated Eps domain-containing protein 2 isoform X1 n=1 Tax=Poecilia mexicana TaxID=48701 RepID=UPI00072EB21C|nr:PREDICTED: ralBP1-associated Eps domain-containing protein 2 isoform X1 [Poecilia mexicana]XP_014848431.1 PREDICTED: ralBP1-associated Eps domain-containing protein 2 isoform X1 [Poecilia mexicana]